MGILAKLLDLVTKLFGLAGDLSKAERERRQAVAALFDKIGDCLDRVAKDFEAEKIPHGACAEMLVYSHELADAVGDVLGYAQADELAQELAEAHNVEGMVVEMRGEAGSLSRLYEIGGKFRALGNLLRAV